MASNPQGPPPPPGGFDPNRPFDPRNRNDPRYDPRLDPANDPRWQREQSRAWRSAQKAQQQVWNDRQRFAAKQQREVLRQQVRTNRAQANAWKQVQRAPSLIGPLLLIAVALVFLLVSSGRISWPALLVWYSHWWPLLLIAIGVLRLMEWGIDRAFRRNSNAPPVRYSIGGGVVFLVVLLAFFGFAAQKGIRTNAHGGIVGFSNGDEFIGFNGNDWKQLLGTKHEQDGVAVSHPIAPNGVLLIDNPRGDVSVTGTSDDGEVHLTVHKEVFTNSDDQAQERLRALDPRFSGADDNLTLSVPAHENDQADLTLLVPAGIRVTVNANHGDIHTGNLKAPIAVTANHGDVDIAAITGGVTVHVNSRNKSLTVHSIAGSLQVEGTGDEINITDVNGGVTVHGEFFGGGRMQHVQGPVEYRTSRVSFTAARLNGEVAFDDHDEFSASEAEGPVTVETRSRNVTLSRIAGEVHVTNSHGRVELVSVPPGGSITVDNHDGDVRVTLPVQARFTLAAETSDGDVSSDFSVAGRNESHGSLNGTVGGGGEALRITTTHGDISVNHNQETALPKPPPPPKLGFGSVPVPPIPPPGTLSPEVRQSLADAQSEVREARKDAQQAAREAAQQAGEAMQQAREKQKEALRLADEARKEAQQKQREAQEKP